VAPMVQNGDSRTLIETLASADFRGADGLIADGADVNRPNEKGLTPLIWSMANGNKQAFDWLLQRGADVNQPVNGAYARFGSAIVHLASRLDDSYFLEHTLRHGGNTECIAVAHFDETPIFVAVENAKRTCLEVLIRFGANVNHQNEFGSPPLKRAIDAHWFEGVYLLLTAGADFALKNNAGFDTAAALLDNDVPLDSTQRRWRAKAIVFLDRKGVDWSAARRLCEQKGFKTLNIDEELKWAGLPRESGLSMEQQ